MKVLIHEQKDTSICIYEIDENMIIGSFFKNKPTVGDIIMSHVRRETNFLYIYEVLEIIENKDANICSSCNYDPVNAYFKLLIRNVTSDAKYVDFDNSINNLN